MGPWRVKFIEIVDRDTGPRYVPDLPDGTKQWVLVRDPVSRVIKLWSRCPICGRGLGYSNLNAEGHEWNGSLDQPTLNPSLGSIPVRSCFFHGWLRNGSLTDNGDTRHLSEVLENDQ